MMPKARREDLDTMEFADKIEIYDRRFDRRFCLDSFIAAVWHSCDGEKSPWEIQKKLKTDISLEVCEDKIWTALTSLRDSGLLTPDAEQVIDHYKPLLPNGNSAVQTAIAN